MAETGYDQTLKISACAVSSLISSDSSPAGPTQNSSLSIIRRANARRTKRMVTNCQERHLCNPFFSLLKLKNKPTHQSCMCCWRILDTFSGRFCLSFEFVPLLFYSWTLSTIYSASAGLFSLLSSNYDKLHVTVVFAVQHWSNIEKCEASKPNLLYMLPRWLACFLC